MRARHARSCARRRRTLRDAGALPPCIHPHRPPCTPHSPEPVSWFPESTTSSAWPSSSSASPDALRRTGPGHHSGGKRPLHAAAPGPASEPPVRAPGGGGLRWAAPGWYGPGVKHTPTGQRHAPDAGVVQVQVMQVLGARGPGGGQRPPHLRRGPGRGQSVGQSALRAGGHGLPGAVLGGAGADRLWAPSRHGCQLLPWYARGPAMR